MKGYVKKYNSGFKKNVVLNLAKRSYARITPEHWQNAIAHCRKFEEMYAEIVSYNSKLSIPSFTILPIPRAGQFEIRRKLSYP